MPPRSPAPLLSPSPTSTSASSAPTSPLRISSWPARKPLAKKCGRCRLTTITAISSRGPSPISRTSAAARAVAPSLAPCSSRNSQATRPGFTWTSPALLGTTTPSPGSPKVPLVWRSALSSTSFCLIDRWPVFTGGGCLPLPSFKRSEKFHFSFPMRKTSLAPLHFLRRLNAQQRQRLHHLRLHPFRQPQQECPFLLIGFRQDVVLVIKIVKRLRQLECILGQERRLLRRNRRIHRVIQ